jgi:hypothetical protein
MDVVEGLKLLVGEEGSRMEARSEHPASSSEPVHVDASVKTELRCFFDLDRLYRSVVGEKQGVSENRLRSAFREEALGPGLTADAL